MTKTALVLGLLLVIVSEESAPMTLEIRALRGEKHAAGCGCSLRLAGQKGAVAFEWEYMQKAWLNVGQPEDLELAFTGQRGSCSAKHVGEVCTSTFVAGPLRAVLRHKVTSVCPADSESCEAWGCVRYAYHHAQFGENERPR